MDNQIIIVFVMLAFLFLFARFFLFLCDESILLQTKAIFVFTCLSCEFISFFFSVPFICIQAGLSYTFVSYSRSSTFFLHLLYLIWKSDVMRATHLIRWNVENETGCQWMDGFLAPLLFVCVLTKWNKRKIDSIEDNFEKIKLWVLQLK